jgi:hypothetical protein
MMQHTGMERNEEQWRQLLSSAGFQIVRIWRAELGTTAIIEVDLKEDEDYGNENGHIGTEGGFDNTCNEGPAATKFGAALNGAPVAAIGSANPIGGFSITANEPADVTDASAITVN